MPPIPASISASKPPPPISGAIKSTVKPTSAVKSLAAGQNTFRMAQVPKSSVRASPSQSQKQLHKQTSVPQMRVNPQVPQPAREVQPPSVVPLPKPFESATLATSPPRVQIAPQPTVISQPEVKPKSSSNLSQLNLPPDTLRMLNILQSKIKLQMQNAGQPITSAALTNALAIAIGQLTKGSSNAKGGSSSGSGSSTTTALANLLKGKNQNQLVSALAAAVAGKKSTTTGPSKPVPIVPKVVTPTTTTTKTNAEGSVPKPDILLPKKDKISAITIPANPVKSKQISPEIAPSTTTHISPSDTMAKGSCSRPNAEVISEMLAKASKLTNPSPSIRAALVQLQAHAAKLGLEIPENLIKMGITEKGTVTECELKRPGAEIDAQKVVKLQKTEDSGGSNGSG